MLISWMKYFQGYVYVRLTGYAPERFLNLCGSHDILIWNLKPDEDGYTFCISIKGFRRLKPFLKKTRTQIRIVRRVGVPFTTFRYRKRKIFFTGIVLSGILLYYLSGFVWNIDVNGNSYLSEEVILDFLSEEDCFFGTKKSAIDCVGLEEALRSRYDEVIWTSVKIYGTKMTVDIQENLLPEEQYEKVENAICDIIAAKDGTITSMITRRGTPLVAAGAAVKKGDILVSGRIGIPDDGGEMAEYIYHTADADVMAQVVYDYHDVIPQFYTESVPTGNVKTDYGFTFFKTVLKNPLFRNKYTDYNVASDTAQLRVTDNFYLPIWLTKETYQELLREEKSRNEQDVRQIATKNLGNYIEDLEEKGIQITEKNVIIKRSGKNYVVSGTIMACESIAAYQPTDTTITGEERQNVNESD